jgi:hypothetical protein
VAHCINRLARKVGLTDSAFMATVQTTPEEIAALPPTLLDDEPAFDEPGSAAESVPAPGQETLVALVLAPAPPKPMHVAPREPQPAADPETPEPQLSASGHTARSSASRIRSPAADGAADVELLDAFPTGATTPVAHAELSPQSRLANKQQRRGSSAERRAPSAERRAPSAERRAPVADRASEDRRLAPALAIDLAALGQAHAADSILDTS